MAQGGWISPELNTGEESVITELFNLKKESYEQFNVAEDHHPNVANRLQKEMQRYARKIGAGLQVKH